MNFDIFPLCYLWWHGVVDHKKSSSWIASNCERANSLVLSSTSNVSGDIDHLSMAMVTSSLYCIVVTKCQVQMVSDRAENRETWLFTKKIGVFLFVFCNNPVVLGDKTMCIKEPS